MMLVAFSALAMVAAAAPSGKYCGKVPVILEMTLTIHDGTADFYSNIHPPLTKPTTVDCKAEAVAMTSTELTFTNLQKTGDCMGDALRGQKKDPSKYTIDIESDGSLKFHSDGYPPLTLKPCSSLEQEEVPQFNNSKCPHWWELQAPHMKMDFDIKDLPGYYYELAFHDVTQYPLCPSRSRCITSEKAIQTHPDGVKFVNDTWNLACYDHPYPQTLLFNVTETPGYLRGYVPDTAIPFLPKGVVAGTVFPDTVVDFKAGPDGWALEFQCVEMDVLGMSRVAFIGINYYSKSNSEEAFREIDAAARARGLYFFIDQGGIPGSKGLRRVNHTDCPKEPHLMQETMTVQI